MTTVLVADDHPLFREAIADALRTMFDRVGVPAR
jgi:DNA-binding NarL/FixJ family response regulator